MPIGPWPGVFWKGGSVILAKPMEYPINQTQGLDWLYVILAQVIYRNILRTSGNLGLPGLQVLFARSYLQIEAFYWLRSLFYRCAMGMWFMALVCAHKLAMVSS